MLEEREDDGDGEHDTGTGSYGAHEVGEDAKTSNADSTESGSDVDVASEVSDHGFFAHTLNGHVILQQVGDDVTWSRSTHIDPNSREESA